MRNRTAPRQTKDALGIWLCRMPECGKPVGKGRRSYCSHECAERFEIAYFPSATRRHVFNRDRGVCAKCGCDTEKIRRLIDCLRYTFRWRWQDLSQFYREMGFHSRHGRSRGAFWQADHIQECVRGGWGTGLENLRTLCTPCHKAETARLARERAIERRMIGSLFTESGAA